jgi:hypothetical protein
MANRDALEAVMNSVLKTKTTNQHNPEIFGRLRVSDARLKNCGHKASFE